MDPLLALQHDLRRHLLLWVFEHRAMRGGDPQRWRAWRLVLADLRRLRNALRAADASAAHTARASVQGSIWLWNSVHNSTEQRAQKQTAQQRQAQSRGATTRSMVKKLADKHLHGIDIKDQVSKLQRHWPARRKRLTDFQLRKLLKELGFRP